MKIRGPIHLLRHDFEISLTPERKIPRYVNSLIIFGETHITLIDSGVKGCWQDISSYITGAGRQPGEVKTLILSHSHPDHLGSAHEIKEKTGCRVIAHRAEKRWYENLELQARERPVPGFTLLADQPVVIDDYIEDGRVIELSPGLSAAIIHAPGHSAGSINLWFPQDKVLFTADSIPLENDIPNYDSFEDLQKSLTTIREAEEVEVLLTSWTPPVFEKVKMMELIDKGFDYLKKLDDAVGEIYADEEARPLDNCRKVVDRLGLPAFYVNPIVDKAFRTHTGHNKKGPLIVV